MGDSIWAGSFVRFQVGQDICWIPVAEMLMSAWMNRG